MGTRWKQGELDDDEKKRVGAHGEEGKWSGAHCPLPSFFRLASDASQRTQLSLSNRFHQ